MPIISKAASLDLGTLTWTSRVYPANPKYYEITAPIPNSVLSIMKRANASTTVQRVKCDKFTIVHWTATVSNNYLYITPSNIATSSAIIYIYSSDYNSVNDFIEALNGNILTYETVGTVEEGIISYKAQQKNKGYNISSYGVTYSVNNNLLSCHGTVSQTPPYNQLSLSQGVLFKRDGTKYAVILPKAIGAIGITGYGTLTTGRAFLWSANASSDWPGFVFLSATEGDRVNFDNIFINIVDVSNLYGRGNEPATIAELLQQHPEYNNYAPYYDGPIHIEEVIL